MGRPGLRNASGLLARAETLVAASGERVRAEYARDVGRGIDEVASPALILDLPAARRNIARMALELERLPAGIRPHVKVHKSPSLARIQHEHGVVGFSVATVWEAAVMAAAGLDDIFVANTLAGAAQVDALIALAGGRHVLVAVDDLANAAMLSAKASAAGVTLGVLIEIDTGMDRAGVDSEDAALALARSVLALPALELEGVTGYEGHCSGVVEADRRASWHRRAMEFFGHVTARLVREGIPVHVRSAGGTTTWRWTAAYPGITEIQAGSYVVMDNFHGRMVDDFESALTVATTVVSRPPDRVIVDAGNKTVGAWPLATIRGLDAPVVRFDEEHGVFGLGSEPPPLGARLQIVPGYAPATVSAFEAFHVAEEGVVVDVWPVVPRGPGHHGMADMS
jgi:D-serine deaminase-like pyridoxal phosphate-dependent protein